jgi:hypothetical protein
MRSIRYLAAAAAAVTALTLMTGVALAGGWAEVGMVDGAEDPPIAGEEREIRFVLLQHGLTAVDDGDVHLTATHEATGDTITVPATGLGGGEWSASVTFPADGSWQIRVTHDELETSPPTMISVGQPDGPGDLAGAVSIGLFGLAAAAVLVGAAAIGRRRRSPSADVAPTPVRAA